MLDLGGDRSVEVEMSEKKMARARELAFEMSSYLTEKIVCLHEASQV